MELLDLHVFRTVAESGGVTKASARLHRVQSNVTKRIRKLEEELGVRLFQRHSRGVQITEQGRVLMDYAVRMLSLAEEARSALMPDRPEGLLRIGAMESTAALRLPMPLAALHRLHPNLRIELKTGLPQELVQQVLSGALHAALVAEPVTDRRLTAKALFDEPLGIVSAARHGPIAHPKDIDEGAALLAFQPGCPHRQRMEDWCARGRLGLRRVVEFSSYHAMLSCIAAGMGVALMPRGVVESFGQKALVQVHPLKGALGSMRIVLVTRKDLRSRRLEVFEQALRESATGATDCSTTVSQR